MPDEEALISLRLAEHIGDRGYEPAYACPQGHRVVAQQAGELCLDCFSRNVTSFDYTPEYIRDPLWKEAEREHPEWIIGRGAHLPLASDLARLLSVVKEWSKRHPCITYGYRHEAASGLTHAYFQDGDKIAEGRNADDALALGKGFLAALDKWGF